MRAEFTLPIYSEDFPYKGHSARLTDCDLYANSVEITIDGYSFSLDKDDLRKVLAILD
jgi:hypothetical protein